MKKTSYKASLRGLSLHTRSKYVPVRTALALMALGINSKLSDETEVYV